MWNFCNSILKDLNRFPADTKRNAWIIGTLVHRVHAVWWRYRTVPSVSATLSVWWRYRTVPSVSATLSVRRPCQVYHVWLHVKYTASNIAILTFYWKFIYMFVSLKNDTFDLRLTLKNLGFQKMGIWDLAKWFKSISWKMWDLRLYLKNVWSTCRVLLRPVIGWRKVRGRIATQIS